MSQKRDPLPPEMVLSYQNGATQKELAERMGKSRQTIRRLLDDAGVETRDYLHGDRSEAAAKVREQWGYDSDQLAYLSSQGWTCAEIADEVGRPEEAVRRAMARRGIPRQASKARPEHNHFWTGGYTVDKHGYILQKLPSHPEANHLGYVRQHRLIMEQELGRALEPGEVVDHRNGDTSDNRPENLRLFPSNAEHLRVTLTGTRNLPPDEREMLRRAAVRRAEQRVAAILSQ